MEPKSPQETRQVFDKQSTALKICRAEVPEQTCSNACRSSSRWHTRAWAQAVIRGVESDAVKRRGACPAEDVQVDLTGADIPDDEFPEEPPNRYPTRQLAILVPTRTWDTPARNCFVALCELVERTRSRFERRTNSSAENKPLKSHVPSKLADTYTEFNQGVGVDLFYSRTQTDKCLSS